METKQTDVIVVGGGAAGLSAAVAAAEAGASVIVLEKNPNTGGNGLFPAGLFAVDSFVQRQLLIDASADEYFKMAMEYAHWRINPRIIRAFIDKSGDTIRWLADMGVDFETAYHHIPGEPEVFHVARGPQSTGQSVMRVLKARLENLGVTVIAKASVQELLLDEKDRIYGVLAEILGEKQTVLGKNVIIATGGFAGDADMVRSYIPSYNENEVLYNAGMRHKGGGIKMAKRIGAAMEETIALEAGAPKYAGAPSIGMLLSKPQAIWVNKNGRRFADEGLVYNFSESANIVWQQPEKACYVLMDEAIKETILRNGMDPVERREMPKGSVQSLPKDLVSEEEKGFAKVSRELNEIAEFIGADAQVLMDTIQEYNACCEKNHDPIFAKDRRYMMPLEKPPYYVIRAGVGFLTTHGGLVVDETMRVLNQEGQPILGLYAAGVDAGGVDDNTYQLALSGHAFSFGINGGRIAGEHAMGSVNAP